MKKQPLYDMDECIVCGGPPQYHHVYPGDRRARSDYEGCIAPLCHYHHQYPFGVHGPDHGGPYRGYRNLDEWLRADCQRRWEEREGVTDHSAFRALFGCNYLD